MSGSTHNGSEDNRRIRDCRGATGSDKTPGSHVYDDIINLPHHVSTTRPHMSIAERAAQFSPFAALTGHGDAIRETARLTEERILLDEDMLVQLDERLAKLAQLTASGVRPEAAVTYFKADERKDGGAYQTKTGQVKQVDLAGRRIIFADRTEIPAGDILEMEIPKT